MNKSLLFVPAKEHMLNKIDDFSADCYIIDLEDSIENNNKKQSLICLEHFLKKHEKNKYFVRLNKNNYIEETEILNKYDIVYMLPKFENVDDYDYKYFNNHQICALIETPLGIVNIRDIACLTYVKYIAFGAEDFAANAGIDNDDSSLIYQKSRIVTFAKAFNKEVYDTPSFQLFDEDKFEKDVLISKKLGFDGKMAIHPKQIDFINKQFYYNNIDELKRIVNEYEKKGNAILVFNNKVYEKMHIEHIKKIINEREK